MVPPVVVPPFNATVKGVFLVHLTLMVLLLVMTPPPGVYGEKANVVAVAEQVDSTVSVTAKLVPVVAELAAAANVAPKISVIA